MTERGQINGETVFRKSQLPKLTLESGNRKNSQIEAILTQRSIQSTEKDISSANDEAFNMTMLKKFPNASLTKSIYRKHAKLQFKKNSTQYDGFSSDDNILETNLKEEDSTFSNHQNSGIKVVENSILYNSLEKIQDSIHGTVSERKKRNGHLNSSTASNFIS